MTRQFLTRNLWWAIPLVITVVALIVALASSLAPNESHHLPARLGYVITLAAFAFSAGWLTRRRVTRDMIFGVAFIVLGLFIMTAQFRIQADRVDAGRAAAGLEAVLAKISSGETIERSEAQSTLASELNISSEEAAQILDAQVRLANEDHLSYDQ